MSFNSPLGDTRSSPHLFPSFAPLLLSFPFLPVSSPKPPPPQLHLSLSPLCLSLSLSQVFMWGFADDSQYLVTSQMECVCVPHYSPAAVHSCTGVTVRVNLTVIHFLWLLAPITKIISGATPSLRHISAGNMRACRQRILALEMNEVPASEGRPNCAFKYLTQPIASASAQLS